MMRFYKIKFKDLLDEQGQVALFIALIFQVLFLFFAMVINIGLVVHHKINLQNSLDLAAYYAASKQAENLNAIAHINYQIRQSWKLMAWRYRMLGSAGDFDAHPYNKNNKKLGNPPYLPYNFPLPDKMPDPGSVPDDITNFYEAPAFCITYVPFKPMPAGENTCKHMAKGSGIKLFKPPDVIAGFLGFSGRVAEVSRQALEKIRDRCMVFGSWNFIMLSTFAASYNSDQRDRQAMISAISHLMSNSTEDFLDLDGESVREGAEKTFTKNLTSANLDGLKSFKIYNPMASDSCNGNDVAKPEGAPPKWLRQIKIYPGFSYLDTSCDADIHYIGKALPFGASDSNNIPKYYNNPKLADLHITMENLLGLIDQDRANPESKHNYSVGVEKNPWCMNYVGASATLTPKIPFLPLGAITLQARSFAKPFGGRVGPWYQSGWSKGSRQSDSGPLIDPLLPPRFLDPSNVASFYTDNETKKRLAANFSRFPGDTVGLKSIRMLGEFGRAVYELDKRWSMIEAGNQEAAAIDNGDAPSFRHWSHLPPGSDGKFDTMDLLSWNTELGNRPSPMRYLELAGVIPDAFDLTYYSIEPDFYNNYYERIVNKFIPKVESFDRQFKPDLGYHKGDKAFENYSVKDQIRDVFTYAAKSPPEGIHLDLNEGGLSYLVKDWANLLTGWSESNLTDYQLADSDFGKCTVFPQKANQDGTGVPEPPMPGNCLQGGRTGYSVKFVSRDFLKSENLELGGKGVSPGAILNPPPEDF